MDTNKNLVPHILCAMSSAPDKQQSVDNLVSFVENRLKEEGINISNVKDDIEKSLKVANKLGLISVSNNTVRLKFNPNSKPSFCSQLFHDQRENRRLLQWTNDEISNVDESQDAITTTEDNKTRRETKPGKKAYICSICGLRQSRIRMRKRKSGGQSKRVRSRSRSSRSRSPRSRSRRRKH